MTSEATSINSWCLGWEKKHVGCNSKFVNILAKQSLNLPVEKQTVKIDYTIFVQWDWKKKPVSFLWASVYGGIAFMASPGGDLASFACYKWNFRERHHHSEQLFNTRSIACLNAYRWRSRLWTRANWTKATFVNFTARSKYWRCCGMTTSFVFIRWVH